MMGAMAMQPGMPMDPGQAGYPQEAFGGFPSAATPVPGSIMSRTVMPPQMVPAAVPFSLYNLGDIYQRRADAARWTSFAPIGVGDPVSPIKAYAPHVYVGDSGEIINHYLPYCAGDVGEGGLFGTILKTVKSIAPKLASAIPGVGLALTAFDVASDLGFNPLKGVGGAISKMIGGGDDDKQAQHDAAVAAGHAAAKGKGHDLGKLASAGKEALKKHMKATKEKHAAAAEVASTIPGAERAIVGGGADANPEYDAAISMDLATQGVSKEDLAEFIAGDAVVGMGDASDAPSAPSGTSAVVNAVATVHALAPPSNILTSAIRWVKGGEGKPGIFRKVYNAILNQWKAPGHKGKAIILAGLAAGLGVAYNAYKKWSSKTPDASGAVSKALPGDEGAHFQELSAKVDKQGFASLTDDEKVFMGSYLSRLHSKGIATEPASKSDVAGLSTPPPLGAIGGAPSGSAAASGDGGSGEGIEGLMKNVWHYAAPILGVAGAAGLIAAILNHFRGGSGGGLMGAAGGPMIPVALIGDPKVRLCKADEISLTSGCAKVDGEWKEVDQIFPLGEGAVGRAVAAQIPARIQTLAIARPIRFQQALPLAGKTTVAANLAMTPMAAGGGGAGGYDLVGEGLDAEAPVYADDAANYEMDFETDKSKREYPNLPSVGYQDFRKK